VFLDRVYLDIEITIDAQGYPEPQCINLRGGRKLPIKGIMSRGEVTTANGVQTIRYEIWVAEHAYVIYLDNGFPLRWYVDVVLPFKVAPEPLPTFMKSTVEADEKKAAG